MWIFFLSFFSSGGIKFCVASTWQKSKLGSYQGKERPFDSFSFFFPWSLKLNLIIMIWPVWTVNSYLTNSYGLFVWYNEVRTLHDFSVFETLELRRIPISVFVLIEMRKKCDSRKQRAEILIKTNIWVLKFGLVELECSHLLRSFFQCFELNLFWNRIVRFERSSNSKLCSTSLVRPSLFMLFVTQVRLALC